MSRKGGRTVELNSEQLEFPPVRPPGPNRGECIRMVCAFALGKKLMGFGCLRNKLPIKKIGGLLLFSVICPCKNFKKPCIKTPRVVKYNLTVYDCNIIEYHGK
jgi:hypothetical protein